MPLRITKCSATPSSITVVFNDAVNHVNDTNPNSATNPTNYTIFAPPGVPASRPLASTDAEIHYHDFQHAVVILFKPAVNLVKGTWVTVQVQEGDANTGKPGVLTVNGHGWDGDQAANVIAAQVNGQADIKEVTEAVEDAVAYPLLTESVSFPPSSGPAPTGGLVVPATGGAPLGQAAARAIGDVLGWKANSADPKGFLTALGQSFSLTEVEGHVEAKWNPRSYAVQTDIGGGIIGAQASLYSRAKDALDKCLPLLDGLYPLNPEADQEDVAALRDMARSQMSEIVKEFGAVGGPSILRVNTYFDILLGSVNTQDPDQIKGTLGSLRDTYGIFFQGNPFSNSVEDEQDITNFRILSDYMTSLLQSWHSNLAFFDPSSKTAFFGTQLVLISRQFSVIAETVNEVRFAFDSVFIGPSERQALLLRFDDPKLPPAFLEYILQEIEYLVGTEGPRLFKEGGRLSVRNNILPVARSLRDIVRGALRPTNLHELPDGYRTVRVRRTLDDLHDQLRDLINLIGPVGRDVPAPETLGVSSIVPPSFKPTGTAATTIHIFGTGFQSTSTVTLKSVTGLTITPSRIEFFSAERIDIAVGTMAPGPYTVSVTNPDGGVATAVLTAQ
jgi:hypothetical protein